MLDKFDAILGNVSKNAEGSEWILEYDQLLNKDKEQVSLYSFWMQVLKFHGLFIKLSLLNSSYISKVSRTMLFYEFTIFLAAKCYQFGKIKN